MPPSASRRRSSRSSGGALVDVEEQVDVREEVGVAARARARQEGASQRPELERGLDDPARERPNVLRRRVHLGRIVDSELLTDEAKTYEAAGVSLATADAVVERLRAAVESTGATGFGSFAGLYPLDDRRFLAASTDGVGSKLMLQRRAGKLRWGGMDLAAHCINDVLCSGAEPLFLLDYVAAEHIELEQVAELVEGAAEVCRAAGCTLIGGETAELPGVYRDDELDFAGTCVGIVDRDDVDRRLTLRARRRHRRLPVERPAHERLLARPRARRRRRLRRRPAPRSAPALSHRRARTPRSADVKALAHVTGGGILGNLSRVLPQACTPRSTGRVAAAARLRLARRSRRRRGRGPARLQPRHRLCAVVASPRRERS